MKVILTHEQADIDALASQLGAWLLFPDALPLLPRNVNRNGRRFIEEYGDKLPYINFKDLQRDPIDEIILVDTQSMITLRGMSKETRVRVYDHHPRRDDLPEDWECFFVQSGANVSQMIARIRQQGVSMNPLHATLLLLGIHEDTGSFTYRSTTAEDMTAAAFCLEKGADLDIVAQFLYPPLSEGQRRVYDRLMRNVDTFMIDDQTIMAAKANGRDVQDEISSIAHLMRDVLNPDALLILVSTPQGIRLVARSTSDRVDVSAIAEAMGGGGHKRAASALVRPTESLDEDEIDGFLDACYQDMITRLDQFVTSKITVANIMSRDPLILAPDTSVQEAHRLMQRYGYEGYPVVANGKVVGLLNRREVDRAISHGLDLTVDSLMAAGNVTVPTDASLEMLQSLMGSTDWGQIPVVLPQTDEIIGIVTRTDLIKTLTPQPELPSQEEVQEKLNEILPPSRLALLQALASEADRINLPIYVVGGFVRDLLLGRPSLDFDVVVEGDAIFFARRLAEKFGGRVLTHQRFGTAKWLTAEIDLEIEHILPEHNHYPESLDLITARTEFYEQPAALPTVESSSIKMDLHRRDFTINTLALRLDGDHFGRIYDYWGGLNDLRKGHIRVLHALSFVDDATRLLRAVRFEQRFDFQIEPRTLALLDESLPLIKKLTGSRIQHEINLILSEPKAAKMVDRLDGLGILKAIHPALPWDETVRTNLEAIDTDAIDPIWDIPEEFDGLSLRQVLSYLVWLGGLSEPTLRSISYRLRCKASLKKLLYATSQINQALPQLTHAKPSDVVHLCDKAPRLAIYAVYLVTRQEDLRERLRMYVRQWHAVEPHTTGNDLRNLGLRPSPIYGQILAALRDAWLDGDIQTAQQENDLLKALIEKHQ